MNCRRISLPLLALATALTMAACHSNSNQNANSQNPQSSPSAPTASSSQPAAPGQPGAPAPGQPGASAPAPAPPPPPEVVHLASGTAIRVRLDQDLGSKISQPGDSFTATVADDITANGQVIVPRGSRADGTVIDAKPLGRFKGGALLEVRLERVHTQWGSYPVATSTVDKVEQGKGKRSAGFIGGGAGLGALIGGLAGGGKGAVLGALAGGGAGTAGSAFTGNKQIVLPAETLLTFRLERGVQITEQGAQSPGSPQ
jgi:hypothetical protein